MVMDVRNGRDAGAGLPAPTYNPNPFLGLFNRPVPGWSVQDL